MELMVHRCTKEDDFRGVEEALCEEAFGMGLVKIMHIILLRIIFKQWWLPPL